MTYHAVLMLCYNQLSMTKAALNSLVVQDIGPLEFWICNNGSNDGTREWLTEFAEFVDDTHRVHLVHNDHNHSPVGVTNQMLKMIFDAGHDKVLAVANDVVLPPNYYQLVTAWPRGFVCGTPTDQREFTKVEEPVTAHSENMPTPVTLIRRWAYIALMEQAGYVLDENYFFYAVDCDLALRIIACGIHPIQVNIPYYHFGSATWRLAPPEEGKRMTDRADVDRAYFAGKWGFAVDQQAYMDTQRDLNFRGKPRG